MTAEVRARAEPEVAERAGLLAGRRWAAVLLLTALSVFNLLDRLLPAILAEPIKRDLQLSDTFLGVLNGVGFLAVYAIAGIPIARIADRGRFGVVIAASLALWSAMTGLASTVATGWQLALTRVGVALGEAGSTPAAQAYVSRNFAPDARATALAVLTLGTPVGAMAGLVAGGLLGEILGWRGAFLAMGVVGLALAPLVLLALGPGRPLPAREASGDLLPALGLLRKPTVLALLAAAAFIGMGGYSVTAFSPAFLMRAHGMSVADVGLRLGVLNGVTTGAVVLGVSWLGARLSRRESGRALAVLALMVAACIPFGLAAYRLEDRTATLVCIALSNTMGVGYLPLTVACLHGVAPAAMGAQASAMLLFFSAVAGGFGPVITGLISDALTPTHGPAALGWALLIQPACFALAAIGFALGTLTLGRDLVEEAAGAGLPT